MIGETERAPYTRTKALTVVISLLVFVAGLAGYLVVYVVRLPSLFGFLACMAALSALYLAGVNLPNRAGLQITVPRTFVYLGTAAAISLTAAQLSAPDKPPLGPQQPIPPSAATSPQTSAPTALSPSPSFPGCPLPTEDNRIIDASWGNAKRNQHLGLASLDGVAADDGKPGVGFNMWVCATVKKAPPPGRQLWLLLRLDPRKDIALPVHFAKYRLSETPGIYAIYVKAFCSVPVKGPRPRTLMVVSADVSASRELQKNHNSDKACDRTYESRRTKLPSGALVVSNTAAINRIE
ncbi:hypothetical protein ACIBEJ_33955 [Nonomuraea sp. NPDC050790]|uniref:hypothetical protein n=1 Tax=Nonomuraea sp. NPDC050790 TaxID=3364371 RepID=UPI0037A84368